MAASQYPGKLGVAYTPAHMQQVGTQSQKNFQGLHQPVSQANTESTGFQYPKSTHSACCPWNSHHQMSSKANADLVSSAHVLAQRSSYFGTSGNENSARESVCSGGQEKECSKEKGSNLNINNGLQPRQHLNFAFSIGFSSSAPQGCGLQVPTQSLPLLDQSYSASKSKLRSSFPLTYSILTGNPVDLKSPSLSRETNAKIEKRTTIPFPDERPCSSQQMEGSLVDLNCGKTTKNLHYSERRKQHISSPCLSSQLSTESISPVGEMMQSKGDYIQDFILKQVAYFRRTSTQNNINGGTYSHKGSDFCTNERDSTLQSDCIMPLSNSAVHLSTTFTSDKEDMERKGLNSAVSGHKTATVGQAHEMDSAKVSKANAETPKSKKTSGCATSTSKEYCTGTLTSGVENLKPGPKTESFERSALVAFDLSVKKKHLDETMPANGDGKLGNSGDCEDKTFVDCSDVSFHSNWCDKYAKNGKTTLRYSLTALKELIVSLENVEPITDMDNFSEVILQQYWNGNIGNIHLFTSTEYPQIMMKVAATCTKNEDESPVVLTAVPREALDELTQKHPSPLFKYSSSQEEYKSLELKPVEGVGLDGVQGVTNVSEEFQTKSNSGVSEPTSLTENQEKEMKNIEHCNVTCKGVIAQSETNSSTDIQIHNVTSVSMNQYEWLCNQASCEGVRKDVCSVAVQTDARLTISENKVKEEALLSSEGKEVLSVKIIKDPQYEDISDDDMSQLATELPNSEHGELNFPEYFQDMHYTDISEDENPPFMATETPSPTQAPEPNKQQTETLDIEQCCSGSCFAKTDDGCHLRRQTERCVCCTSSVLTDDDTDEQMDDDWLVIPVTVANLKFEPDDEHQNSPEKVVLSGSDEETQCDVSPAHNELHSPASSPSYQIDVYDTTESCLKAMRVQFQRNFEMAAFLYPPEYALESEGTPQTPQNRSESYSDPEDSCETEDSFDYPYSPESRQLSWKRSVSLPIETDDHVSEKAREDEVTNAQNDQNRDLDTLGCMQKQRQQINTKTTGKHVKRTCRQRNSKNDVIIINSDTEDESDENCKKKAERKRLFSSSSDNSGDAPCSPQKRHSPGDSQAPPRQAPKTPAETNKNSDSPEKHLHKNKKERYMPISKPADDRRHSNKNIVQANTAKSRLFSRPLSSPSQEGPSTSIGNLSARSGQPSEPRQSSASSRGLFQSGETSASRRVPTYKQSISTPRKHLSSSNHQLPRSYSSPSTVGHPCTPTKGSPSATMQSSARKQVIKDWQNSFFPTRRDRKSNLQMDEDLRTGNSDSYRESRPGLSHCDRVPRQRHNFRESERPLMKRTKSDARQWTKAINRDTSVKESSSVGDGYKWSEKKSAKGSRH
uniref:uncharacterized protein LOC124053619 isoform X1 n=1 Tax=Scatophagus argus TaxID=75038 RepID=UPI001ED82A94|nr:uncharacterized protein LOC124053619 isoform X1 [Scatophagus argus]XP_046234901.1 uncharacterized protein LOC124053619 isoform X1 [Scatophagus argus]